jgi:hypothetical protein
LPLRSTLVALLVALVAAPAASASTTKLDHRTLSYTAAPGEANDVQLSAVGGYYVLEDAGAASLDVTGRGCGAVAGRVFCEQRKVETIAIDLGDGDDSLALEGDIAAQVTCATASDCGADQTAPVDPEPVAETPPPAPPAPPSSPIVPESVVAGGPPVTISSAPVAIDAHGRVPVAVSCPELAASGCAGRVTVAMPTANARRTAKTAATAPVLGRSHRFKLSAGQTKVVPVKLDRRAARIIKRRGGGRRRVKLAVTVEVTTATGTQAATSTITVKLPRR